MEYCQNCGHQCHCGTSCLQDMVSEFNEKYQIECCKSCRHEKKPKVDSMDYDSFNGA